MTQLLLASSVVVVAIVVAVALNRRRRVEAPSQPRWAVPGQLDRRDFPRPDAPWLVVVFSSETCDACARTIRQAAVLESRDVAVADVSYQAAGELHRRYAVQAVPMVVVADAAGVVRASFVGPPTATDLWAAVAEVRQPGSSPEPHLGRDAGRTAPPGQAGTAAPAGPDA